MASLLVSPLVYPLAHYIHIHLCAIGLSTTENLSLSDTYPCGALEGLNKGEVL